MSISILKKILVPFDFNPQFVCSLDIAKQIAVRTGAKISIISQLTMPVNNGFARNLLQPILNYSSQIKRLKSEIKSLFSDAENQEMIEDIHVKIGSWNNVIIDITEQQQFDLIIAPNFSKNFMQRLFSNINILDIIEKTKLPVISINHPIETYQLKKIVMPIREVDNWFDKVPFATGLAMLTGAKIFMIGLSNTDSQLLQEKLRANITYCKSFFTKHDVDFECVEKYSSKANYEDVILLAQYKQADLIVISPPLDYYKIKSYFNNNFYNKITSTTNIPVMGHTLI